MSKWSAAYGTEVHNYAEACVKGGGRPEPTSTLSRMAYDAVNEALRMISRHYDILGSECLVFDPLFRVAGTIDLPLRHKATGKLCIADWKTNQAIDVTPRFAGRGRPPIEHIPDCNGNHYRLQFALYADSYRGPSANSGEDYELGYAAQSLRISSFAAKKITDANVIGTDERTVL